MTHPKIPATLAILLATGGCAGSDTVFPSLAPRPVEKPVADPDAATVPAAIAVPDPALTQKLAAIARDAQAGQAAFAAARITTEAAIARAKGASPGDESWLTAQQALTALDAARAATQGAQSTLDALASDQAQNGAAASYAGDQAAIAALVATLTTMADAQGTSYDALAARLPQP